MGQGLTPSTELGHPPPPAHQPRRTVAALPVQPLHDLLLHGSLPAVSQDSAHRPRGSRPGAHNSHPTGQFYKDERLHAIMEKGGIADCGNAQNCVKVCPKDIPLTQAIGELGRQTTMQWLRDFFVS